MTQNDFLLKYWKYYIQIEKEFAQTTNYVSVDPINFNTYSDAYMKIMLQIGSEVDIACKLLCDILGRKLKDSSINKYRVIILEHIKDFASIRIKEKIYGFSCCPWEEWDIKKESPTWWKIYNKIKHHRVSVGQIVGIKQEYYKFANQKYTLMALMGLYQLMLTAYYFLSKKLGKRIFVPLPASRMFETNSYVWKDVDFGSNVLMSYDDGTLFCDTPLFEY